MGRETDERLESQAESVQEATPDGDRQEVAAPAPTGWRDLYRHGQNVIDGLPAPARVAIGLALAVLAAMVPTASQFRTLSVGAICP